MKRGVRSAWVILVLPWWLGVLASDYRVAKPMPNATIQIPLSAVPLEDASAISRVQLVPGEKGVALLYSMTRASSGPRRGYETSISSIGTMSGAQPSSPLWVISQMLPPPPSWDAAPASSPPYPIVYEKALGATYALVLRTAKRADAAFAGDSPFESFTRPRFVKGSEDDHLRVVTAICDEKSAVLFLQEPDGRYQKHAKLCDCSDALILKHGDDFILFYKVTVPGPVRGKLLQPGKLMYVKLGKDFAPGGVPKEVLPGSVVFEFDAAAHESNLAILATTRAGTVLALGSSLLVPLLEETFEEKQKGELASSPSVLLTDSRVDVAMIESAQTRQARVLIGSVAAADPGH